MMTHILFFLATILAGTLNALAGGGGLITFPLLMLVVPPVTADATSAVALFFAYPTAVWRTRSQLNGVFGRGWLWVLLVPCVLGGLIGAFLAQRLPPYEAALAGVYLHGLAAEVLTQEGQGPAGLTAGELAPKVRSLLNQLFYMA